MSERERERLYFRLCLVFALASPLAVFSLARTGFELSFNPLVSSALWFASVPFAILVDLLRTTLCGEPVRLWVVKPTVNAGRSLTQSAAQAQAAVASRLSECGFEYASWAADDLGDAAVKFRKAKGPALYSFLDHGFFGEMSFKETDAGSALTCKLTFDDTLILETGEFERMRALCDYFMLKTNAFAYESAPLTVYCGLSLAFVTVLASLAPHRVFGDTSLTCLAVSAAGMLAASAVIISRSGGGLFGYRLVAGGLCLASVPFAAKLAALMFLP